MTSHITLIVARLILISMVLDQILINCMPNGEELKTSGELNARLDANAINFLEKSVNIPVGINDEIVNRIRSILKRYENQIFELRSEINNCGTFKNQLRCSNINTKLEDTKRNLRNDLNNMRLRILTSLPTSNNLLNKFFDRMYNIFRDYILHINFQFSVTKTPNQTTTMASTNGSVSQDPTVGPEGSSSTTAEPTTEEPAPGEM